MTDIAPLAPRIAARALDIAVLVAADVGLGLVMGFGFDWLAVGTSLVFAYFVLADTLAGATLGKAAVGLRVRGPHGGRPTLRESAIREAFTVLGAIPFVGPLLAFAAWGVIGAGIRREGHGLHDRLAGGTRVVRI
jgi:uncharacterized RDD family membrane protein YckC